MSDLKDKIGEHLLAILVSVSLFEWNNLTVEIRGPFIDLFANGQHVGSTVTFDDVRGSLGCFLVAPGMVAVFRDITVSPD